MLRQRIVSIVQRRLTDYRVPLFEALREGLSRDGTALKLFHGVGTATEVAKRDQGQIDWSHPLKTTYLLRDKLCWQPFRSAVSGSDLVIVTQENKLVNNWPALFLPRPYRLAFWGHGANLQARNPSGFLEKAKRLTTCRVDWWFAYTSQSVELVVQQGFPRHKITNLENSIDTSALRQVIANVSSDEIRSFRAKWSLGTSRLLLFIGSLYADKRLEFLVESVAKLRETHPDIALLIAGDGPMKDFVESAAQCHRWIRYVGRAAGRDKAVLLRAAEIVVNPGLVGLSILDSFAAGVPVLTTDCGLHSPEIDYLSHGANGLMTENSIGAYVCAVESLLHSDSLLQRLRNGAVAAGRRYTIENMANNFRLGINGALS